MPLKEVDAQQKFACPACGGEAQWHPGKQALVCAYCGTESPYRIEAAGEIVEHDLVATLKAVPQSARGLLERRQVRCQHCQAISFFSAEQQGRRCDFCGSTALLPFDEGLDVIRPQSLLPFKVAEPEARNRLRQWYGSRFWAPNALKHRALTDTLHGVYLPYWTFDAQVEADWTAEAGHYFYETRTVIVNGQPQARQVQRIRWEPAAGHVSHFFDDDLVCASVGVQPALIRGVEPFPTHELKPYDAGYVAGWVVERYQIDLVAAAQRGKADLARRARAGVAVAYPHAHLAEINLAAFGGSAAQHERGA